MSQSKRKKQSESSEETQETKSVKKVDLKPVMNFDAYFQHLMKAKKVSAHHKAPMRKFAQKMKLVEGTKDEFEKIFKLY